VLLLEGGGFEYDDKVQDLYAGKNTGQNYFPLKSSRLHYFGGTTGHWGGYCSTFDEIDFHKRDWVPWSGWPMKRADLDPFYARAHHIVELGSYNYSYAYWKYEMPYLKPLLPDDKVVWNKMWQFSPPTRFAEKYKDTIVNAPNVHLYTHANVVDITASENTGEVTELITGLSRHWMTIALALGTLLLQIFIPYHRYVRFLKWLTLSLLAYAAVLFTVHVPWAQVALRTVWPQMKFNATTATVVVGVFGTTISPYLFFWQASEEVEDMQADHERSLVRDSRAAPKELRRIRWDTWSGMLYSNIAAYCIILATAVTLHVAGITEINTAAQAASALRPLAGDFAYFLFALGILGVGLIGVPVLAGSAAYALCEAMGWNWGLERKATDARAFYGVISISVLAGLVLQYSPVSPMKALFWSAVINGVVAVPLIVVIILLVSKRTVMGPFVAGRMLVGLGWVTASVMAAAALAMLIPG